MRFKTATLGLIFLAHGLPGIAGPASSSGSAAGPAVPRLEYRSVFEDYQPYRHQTVNPWRESNDRVGAIGGWRTYAREAMEPEATPPSDPHGPEGGGSHGSPGGRPNGAGP